ncbi:LLM class flavin-dependent oxidoreductase [Micromonospora pisi]|uniref:LLM class flavin-dependent oxidoreductase n=1 Tax=Micromonospora pisi TaxID=589240 RepID=UPI001FE477D3|nr:LLM class flavin-dependent oxidoreductase [Micromonospora pisi]
MSSANTHRLEFGTLVTPVSTSPETPVELARHSEALGFDLVTFAGISGQPAHLDTWTLLSWIAGRTERIRLAANLISGPPQYPTVLAQSAASLDLLSGGRLALALSAANQAVVVAPAGPRLNPLGAIDALGESVDVIRAVLAAGEPGPVHYAGRHLRLDGAPRGPLPAHEIPIWLGGTAPRLLRLVAAKADGWLTTLGPDGPDDLRKGNRIIDEAARKAGRDPAGIRRLVTISGEFSGTRQGFLHGPAAGWVEDLLPLVVADGVRTIVLASDDVEAMARFAGEVAPALRAAAEQTLPAPSRGPRRGAAVCAQRRPGIAYDEVPDSLADTAVEPGDPGYAGVRSNFFRGGAPGLVLRPRTPAEVAEALAYARAHREVPLGIRSGGHGLRGRSTNDGGIVIDVGLMNEIEVLDKATRRVRLGPGARWMHVAAALEPYGWALTSGDHGGVAVGGLATAGGVGWLARKHGLTIDHLRAVELVLADGTPVRASETEHPDLFWAVRGAGAAFGVATAFEFEVDEIGDVGWATFTLDASDPAEVITRWGAFVEASSRDVTSALVLGPGQPVAQVSALVDSADPDTIVRHLQPIADIAPGYDQRVVITPYASVLANASDGPHHGHGEPVIRSGLFTHLTPEVARAAARLLSSGAVFYFHIRAVGGAVNDIDADATAWSNRTANFHLAVLGRSQKRLNEVWDAVMAEHQDGNYLNFEVDGRPERLAEAYAPTTLARLRGLKTQYDPDNLFDDNVTLTPGTTLRTAS